MEDFLQGVSNEHRTIYYAVELKVMDIKQSIKTKGVGLTSNEVKTGSVEMLNHFYMLQSIFEHSHIAHIYQLVKNITINFNSVLAILLEKVELAQRENSLLLNAKAQEKGGIKEEESAQVSSKLGGERRRRNLGGIHLYNQDYSRYIQDQLILEQIKFQKERRLERKRKDILRQSILDELNHQTDVEEFPANSEDIANYIVRTKDKSSAFNYVSYQPELNSILAYFQNCQSEANQFLLKKARNSQDENSTFSFADFHREIMLRNSEFKKEVGQKLRHFITRFRCKEKELQEYCLKRQKQVREQVRESKTNEWVQTQFSFTQFEQQKALQLQQLQEKCIRLQTLGRLNNSNLSKQYQMMQQLSIKQSQIERSNRKVAQLSSSLESMKQSLKDQKLKKAVSRDEKQKPQALPVIVSKQKEQDLKQKIEQKYSSLQENVVAPRQSLKKTMSKNKYIKKTQKYEVRDVASFMSFNEDKKNEPKREKNIAVKYQATMKLEDSQAKQSSKDLSNSFKRKTENVELKYVYSEILTQDPQADKQPSSEVLKSVDQLINKKSHQQIKVNAKSSKTLRSQKQLTFDIHQEDKTPTVNAQQEHAVHKEKSIQVGSTRVMSELVSPYVPKEKSKEKQYTSPKKAQAKMPIDQNQPKIKKAKEPRQSYKIPKEQKAKSSKNDLQKPNNKQLKTSPNEQTKSKPQNSQQSKSFNNHQPKPFHNQQSKPLQKQKPAKKEKQQKTRKTQSKKSNQKPTKNEEYKSKDEGHLVSKEEQQYIAPWERYDIESEQDQEEEVKQQKHVQTSPPIQKSKRLMTNLNAELKKIKEQHAFSLCHLFSITLNPSTIKHQKHKNVTQMTQTSEDIPEIPEVGEQKLQQAFDILMKNESNGTKVQKIRKWRKIMQGHIKSSVITHKEMGQIMCIIQGWAYQNRIYQLETEQNPTTHKDSPIKQIDSKNNPRKSKMPILHNKEIEQQQPPLSNRVQAQIEKQLGDLIRYKALSSNFASQFHHLHKSCREKGTVCSHVTSYLERVMKYAEEKQKRGRKPLILPIQSIGEMMLMNEQAKPKEDKPLKGRSQHKENSFARNYSFNANKSQLLLPNIIHKRASNYRS